MPPEHNILVISDLHLGEDLRPGVDAQTVRALQSLERALVSFLNHYARERRRGLPWRLVINGDMIDFLSITVMPSELDSASGWGEDAHFYGLGTRRRAALLKLDRVLERHAVVFDALGGFLAAGHAVAIVAGNHDAELHWRCVQVRLRDDLARRAARHAPEAQPDRLDLAFHPWVYFEAGVVWAEHGHQYDAYCSFEDVLDPVDPTEEEIDLNVGSAIMRFIGNHHTPDRAAHWDLNPIGIALWLAALGRDRLLAIGAAYVAMVARLYTVLARRWARPAAWTARHTRHRTRLATLARRIQVLAAALRLDRVALLGGGSALLLACAIFLPWPALPPAILLLLGLAIGVDRLLEPEREPIDPAEAMREASSAIRDALRPAAVVFGHSHEPVARHLGGGDWYFNTGTWIPLAHPGESRSFTHVLVEHEPTGARAALFRWTGDRSGPF